MTSAIAESMTKNFSEQLNKHTQKTFSLNDNIANETKIIFSEINSKGNRNYSDVTLQILNTSSETYQSIGSNNDSTKYKQDSDETEHESVRGEDEELSGLCCDGLRKRFVRISSSNKKSKSWNEVITRNWNSLQFVFVNLFQDQSRVYYLGHTKTIMYKGAGATDIAVNKLSHENYQNRFKSYYKMDFTDKCLNLVWENKSGSTVQFIQTPTSCDITFKYRRITFCEINRDDQKILSWIYRHEGTHLTVKLCCHAVICASSAAARYLENKISTMQKLALSEHKRKIQNRQFNPEMALESKFQISKININEKSAKILFPIFEDSDDVSS